MRIDVALTAHTAGAMPLAGVSVLVIDVLRASTSIITALINGCAAVIPVATAEEAHQRAGALPSHTVLIAGERGAISLEDHACAGLLVDRLQQEEPAAELSPTAREALAVGRRYGKDVGRLGEDSSWARHLTSRGRGRDVAACLMLDTRTVVPVYRPNVDNVVIGSR